MACLAEQVLWIEWAHANYRPIWSSLLSFWRQRVPQLERRACIHSRPWGSCTWLWVTTVITSSPQVGMSGPMKVRTPRSQLVSTGAEIEVGSYCVREGQPRKRSAGSVDSRKAKDFNLDFKNGLTQTLLYRLVWNRATSMRRDIQWRKSFEIPPISHSESQWLCC